MLGPGGEASAVAHADADDVRTQFAQGRNMDNSAFTRVGHLESFDHFAGYVRMLRGCLANAHLGSRGQAHALLACAMGWLRSC